MRIVGGMHKGLRLASPKSNAVRPTSDQMREALFNILVHGMEGFELEGARVLDLFAGTGALGLEALSRGARFCLFIEEDAAARALIRQNVETMGATGISKLWRRDALRLGKLKKLQPFDLLFADPPYGRGFGEKAIISALENDWLKDDAICILEETAKVELTKIEGLELSSARVCGNTRIAIFRRSQ